jgi:hypothetical protein
MTTITLDRIALRTLIEADPKFELQLKNAVIAEVGRRFFQKDAKRVIAAAEPELFAKALSGVQENADMLQLIREALNKSLVTRDTNWSSKVRLTDETRSLIQEHALAVINSEIRKPTDAMQVDIGKRVQEALERALALLNIDDRIQKRVERLTEDYIAARAKEIFDQRMAGLRAALQ